MKQQDLEIKVPKPRLSSPLTPGAPLYREVKRSLTESLQRGEWKPGDAIASERQLTERFGVSIGTLRKAVDEMVAEKLLIRHQGRGTFVASHQGERQFFYFFDIGSPEGEKQYPTVELLSFAKGRADATRAAQLGIATGGPVFRFTNLLSIDGTPTLIDEVEVAEFRFPGLSRKALLARPHTVYHFYEEAYGISVVRTEEKLSAVLANDEQATLLGLESGDPLLCVQRLAYSYRDQVVEARRTLVDTREHVYLSQRGRSG